MRSIDFVIYFLVVVAGFSSCSGYSITGGPGPLVSPPLYSEVSPDFQPLRINEIALYPLVADTPRQVVESSLSLLTEELRQVITQETSLKVSTDKLGEAWNLVKPKAISSRQKAQVFGQHLDSPAVIYGVVKHYIPDSPRQALDRSEHAAAFQLWLIDSSSGDVLWSANFEKRNQPLSSNLFRLGQVLDDGVRYRTSHQMTIDGFRLAARDLEEIRTKASLLQQHPSTAQ